MALDLRVTYEFPNYKVGNESGDELDLTLEFYNGDVDETYQAHDVGIRVLKWGKLSWDYKLDSGLLVPADVNMEFYDGEGRLWAGFFGDPTIALVEDWDTEARIVIRINGTTEFEGHVRNESIVAERVNENAYVIKFAASVRTNLLNETRVYDNDDTGTQGALADDLSWGVNTNYIKLGTYLTDLYELMGDSLTAGNLELQSHWAFKGTKLTGGGATNENFGIDDIEIRVGPVGRNKSGSANINSVADIIRNFAICFGSFTGVIHQSKVFFHQLFAYDFSNTQTLGKVGGRIRRTYEFNRLVYTEFDISTDFDDEPDDPFTAGTLARLDDRILQHNMIAYAWDPPINPKVSNIEADGIVNVGSRYRIDLIIWTAFKSGEHEVVQWAADYWHNFRKYDIASSPYSFDIFPKVEGLGYDYLKKFAYSIDGDSFKYQIISMTKHLDRGYTDIKAINLGTNPTT